MTQSDPTIRVTAPGRNWRWPLGAVAALTPFISANIFMTGAEAGLIYQGLLVAFVTLTVGPRAALSASIAVATVVFFGLLFSNNAWVASVYMVSLGLVVVWSYRRGWQLATTYVVTQGALAAVAAPQVSIMAEQPASSLASAAMSATLVLASALWVTLVGYLLLYDLPSLPPKKSTPREQVLFAITLCLSLGVATYIMMTYSTGNHSWWVLLTIMVVLAPGYRHTVRRAIERAGGTVAGGMVAMLLVHFIDNKIALTVIGVIAAIATLVTFIAAPYWAFSFSLTIAIVLLMLPIDQATQNTYERMSYTVLTALGVVALGALITFIANRLAKYHAVTAP